MSISIVFRYRFLSNMMKKYFYSRGTRGGMCVTLNLQNPIYAFCIDLFSLYARLYTTSRGSSFTDTLPRCISVFVSFPSALHSPSIHLVRLFLCLPLAESTHVCTMWGSGTLITSMATTPRCTGNVPSSLFQSCNSSIARWYFSIDYLSCNYPIDRLISEQINAILLTSYQRYVAKLLPIIEF